MSTYAPEIRDKAADESRLVSIDCRGKLDGTQDSDDVWTGETLTGTPTSSFSPDDLEADDFAIASIFVSDAVLNINGEDVPIGCALQCLLTGGTVGTLYSVKLTCSTTSTPAQIEDFGFKVLITDE